MSYSCLRLVLFICASFILYSCASTPEEEKAPEAEQIRSAETAETAELERPEASLPGRFRDGPDAGLVSKLPPPILTQKEERKLVDLEQRTEETKPKEAGKKSRISGRINDELYEIHLPDIELPEETEIPTTDSQEANLRPEPDKEETEEVIIQQGTDRAPQRLGQEGSTPDGRGNDFSRGMESIHLEPLPNLSLAERRTERRDALSHAREQEEIRLQEKTPRQTETSRREADTVQPEITEEASELEFRPQEQEQTQTQPQEQEERSEVPTRERAESRAEEVDWQRIVLPPISGQELIIEFPESGWIYLGERDGNENIEFQEKYRNDTGEVFVFSLEAPGEYYLRFQRQDLRRAEQENTELSLSLADEGSDREERVLITRGSDNRLELAETEETSQDQMRAPDEDREETASSLTQSEDSGIEEEGLEPGDYSRADALYEDNKYEEALLEYQRQYTGDDPALQNRIADILRRLDRLNEAGEAYRENAELPGTQGKKAREALYEIARTLNDPQLLEDSLTMLGERDEISIDNELLNSIEALGDNGRIGSAIDILENLEEKNRFSSYHDRILFLLGRMYEQESEHKSIKKALSFYEKLEEAYPVSEHWGAAQDRIRYLNRHFIHIR